MKKLFRNPVFIPKATSNDLSELDLRYPAILMDAAQASQKYKVAKKARTITDQFIIDPITHKLIYKEASQRKTIKKLSYGDIEFEKIYSNPNSRAELIKHCIKIQIDYGATVLIAPYFFFDDVEDSRFTLNLTLLSESIKYVAENGIQLPLFAMIFLGTNALSIPRKTNFVLDRYREYSSKIQGYFITVDTFYTHKGPIEALNGLAYLVHSLSVLNDIIVNCMGDFGEILGALGISGFSSGLGDGESTSVKSLQIPPDPKRKGFKSRTKDWTYIPEIFSYVNDADVKKINYKCSCLACNGTFPSSIKAKKQHFLIRKMGFMEELGHIEPLKRVDYMIRMIEGARKRLVEYRIITPSLISNHLDLWESVLVASKKWVPPEDLDELENILNELR